MDDIRAMLEAQRSEREPYRLQHARAGRIGKALYIAGLLAAGEEFGMFWYNPQYEDCSASDHMLRMMKKAGL